MGLLIVIEGDENASGTHVDIPMEIHSSIILAAKEHDNKAFSLVRRMNRYYGDILYDSNEIQSLIEELHFIYNIIGLDLVKHIIALCAEAQNKQLGIETIAD